MFVTLTAVPTTVAACLSVRQPRERCAARQGFHGLGLPWTFFKIKRDFHDHSTWVSDDLKFHDSFATGSPDGSGRTRNCYHEKTEATFKVPKPQVGLVESA